MIWDNKKNMPKYDLIPTKKIKLYQNYLRRSLVFKTGEKILNYKKNYAVIFLYAKKLFKVNNKDTKIRYMDLFSRFFVLTLSRGYV